jgi:hypothetical protein
MKINLDVTKSQTSEVFGITKEECDQITKLTDKEYVDKVGKEDIKRTEVLKIILEQIPEHCIPYACFFIGYVIGSFENGYEQWKRKG